MRNYNTFRVARRVIYIVFFLSLFLLCAILLIRSGVFSSEPAIEISADNCYEETLIAVADNDYLPYSFYDENGNASGHDVEIITRIANDLHMNLELKFTSWNEAVHDFVDGKVDVLLTCDYLDRFEGMESHLVTEPVYIDDFVVYSKTDIDNIDELYQKKLAIMENANVMPYLEMLGLENRCLIFSSNKTAMDAVETGGADCAVMRYDVGEAIRKNRNYSDIQSTISIGQSYICFAVGGDKVELRDRLNASIESLKASGEIDRLHEKWLTTFVHTYSLAEIVKNNIWIVFVLAFLGLAALILYIRNEKLRLRAEAENSARIMALEDKFESLYDIELDTGKYEHYIKGQAFGFIRTRIEEGKDFQLDTLHNLDVVYPEDRNYVLNVLKTENIRQSLEERNHFDSYFRLITGESYVWARMRILYKDENKRNVIIGVFDADEEMGSRLYDEQRRKDQIAKMTGGVSSYIVNPQTGRFIILTQNEHLAENYPEEEDFNTSISRYIKSDVFMPDKKKARDGLSLYTMVRALETEKEYTFRYRDNSSGLPRWYELRAVKLSDSEILYGFTDRNDEVINQMIFERLEADFFALFYLNLEAETVEVLKDRPGLIAPKGNLISYDTFIDKLTVGSEGEIKEYLEKSSNISYLKERFQQENKSIFLYKSQINGNKWAAVTEFVLSRYDDGGPALIAIGFSYLDEEAGEKEELKLELKQARDAADAANKAKTNFLFNMSHDIRTPMNAIAGFTLMAKKYIDDRTRVGEYLDKIETSGQQLLTLINQVLEMARIESGRIELADNHVVISEEYNSLMTVFSEQASVAGLNFDSKLTDIVHDRVIADKARMSSIVLNIVGNSMKYTMKGGKIDLTLREIPGRKEGYAGFVMTVTDTGIGMSEEYLKELFDPFSRENSTTVSRIQGTGLGMSIVRELVDIMGGDIKVQSKPGRGTRFDITVDLRIDDEQDIASEAEQTSGSISFAGRKVLLVEDNEMNREIAADILEEEGFSVETAEDGSIAVELLKDRGPDYYDIILMDIQMPVMGGFEATAEIRRLYPGLRIPIVALSANAFSEDREASLEAGMDAHVAKPIRIKELMEVMERFL